MQNVFAASSSLNFVSSFDGSYGSDTTQEDFFNNEVAPIVDTVFKGINTTIFAYGITGAGKIVDH